MKLIHCIHLQQLELTQRAVASHEKATDIAKVLMTHVIWAEYMIDIDNS